MNDLQSRIKKLSGWAHPTKVHDNFPSYIKKIHFPFFRNLEKGTEITFDFPLTVFVGQNGCGKSSALQALYGCPEGKSGGTYWFNTATDPIPESSDGIPPSVWFEYFNKDAKQDVQILKCRISYKKKTGRVIPDYWEPSRPVTKYGMNPFISGDGPGKLKTRWKGLKKDVLYLDFRAELSAFDKYFYFGSDPHGKKIISKQDFLRRHSKDLQRIFNGSGVITRKIRKKDKWRALNEELIVFLTWR